MPSPALVPETVVRYRASQRFPPRSVMSTTDSMPATGLAQRARQIKAAEMETYLARTPRSREATARAKRSLPLGVSSSFQAYDPHPIVAARAQASWLEDVDGNHYI